MYILAILVNIVLNFTRLIQDLYEGKIVPINPKSTVKDAFQWFNKSVNDPRILEIPFCVQIVFNEKDWPTGQQQCSLS